MALALGVLLTALTGTSGAAGAESTGPRVLSVKLDPAAVVGRPAELQVTAVDGKAPVSGVAVRFGREQSFGLSACFAGSSGTPRPPDPFAGGSTVRFAVPHTFRRAGPRGCSCASTPAAARYPARARSSR